MDCLAPRRSGLFETGNRLRGWHFIGLLLKCLPPLAALMDPLSAQEAFIIAKKIVRLVVALAAIAVAATLFAQQGTKPAKAAEGTLIGARAGL